MHAGTYEVLVDDAQGSKNNKQQPQPAAQSIDRIRGACDECS